MGKQTIKDIYQYGVQAQDDKINKGYFNYTSGKKPIRKNLREIIANTDNNLSTLVKASMNSRLDVEIRFRKQEAPVNPNNKLTLVFDEETLSEKHSNTDN